MSTFGRRPDPERVARELIDGLESGELVLGGRPAEPPPEPPFWRLWNTWALVGTFLLLSGGLIALYASRHRPQPRPAPAPSERVTGHVTGVMAGDAKIRILERYTVTQLMSATEGADPSSGQYLVVTPGPGPAAFLCHFTAARPFAPEVAPGDLVTVAGRFSHKEEGVTILLDCELIERAPGTQQP